MHGAADRRSPTVRTVIGALAVLAGIVASLASGPALSLTASEAKTPMVVALVRSDAADCGTTCPEWLALTGKIMPDTARRFEAALARIGPRRVPVLIDSPGGSVEAALAMGRMIRARRLDVAVAATAMTDCPKTDQACLGRRRAGIRPGFIAGGTAFCASACVLVLAAGIDRSAGTGSYVGVHQMSLRRTLTRVLNTFRIVRQRIGGRMVEVSRTLIARRPVSTRVEIGASPESLYTEVDRYLLGMGTREAIMPIMRATPPDRIHRMTPAELSDTGVVNDTTDARTLLVQAEPGARVFRGRMAAEAAVLSLGDGQRLEGTVRWRVDPTSGTTPNVPRLIGEVDIAARLSASITLARNTDPGRGASFVLTAQVFDTGSPAPDSIEAPILCDTERCSMRSLDGVAKDSGVTTYEFWIGPREENALLSALRDRTKLTLPIRFIDAMPGQLGLTLSGQSRPAIFDWEHLCCDLPVPPVSTSSPPPGRNAASAIRM